MKILKKIGIGIVSIMLVIINFFMCPNCSEVMAYSDEMIFDNFTSESYILIDANSKTILYGKNAEQKTPVASICKLMTTLLTLERIEAGELSLDDTFVASEYACSVEGSQAFLDAGSEYKVSELLKSVIIASANDSAIVLAEGICGSEMDFVNLMNEKAKRLGMENTLYSNCTGLEKPNQYSTALDTAKLLMEISKYQVYKDDCSVWMDKFVHPSGRETDLVNTNRLIKYYSNCVCGKTGFTDDAGYCLSAMASKNDMNLIAVALKCDTSADRFKECMELFNYGFANFENKKIIDKNVTLQQEIVVRGGKDSYSKLVAKDDVYIIVKRGDNQNIEIRYNLPEVILAPCDSTSTIGKIVILKKGVVIAEVDVCPKEDIEKQNYSDILTKIFDNWGL